MSDKELIMSVLNGRVDDFGVLVGKYSGKIYRLCFSLCGNGFDAEDATQEAFVDAYLYLASLSDVEKFLPWLCSIARRKVYKQISLRRSDCDIDEMSELLPSADASPYDAILSAEKSNRISQALEKLSDKRRTIAEMFYIENMKIREISRKLSLSDNTVKSRLYDAREYLRKELDDMNDYKPSTTTLEERIKEQIKVLSRYYALNGGSFDEKYDSEIDKTIELIDKIEDNKTKQNYLASVLSYKCESSSVDENERKRLTERKNKAAEEGKNAEIIASALINDYFNIDDKKRALTFIDETALPKISEYAGTLEGDSAKGELMFWRGRTLIKLNRLDEAKADFEKAAQLTEKPNAYYANVMAAIREIDYMNENAHDAAQGFGATAEGLLINGSRVVFYNQPGFSEYFRIPGIKRDFDSFVYYASFCRRTLVDTAMKPGDRITDTNNSASLECISTDESVSVILGEFHGCLHMKTEAAPEYLGKYSLDAWYAPGVGLVKVTVLYDAKTEDYELAEYTIKGGTGFMPLALGNRWVYINPDIPDWIYQRIERTVEYTDGKLTNLSVISPFTLSKNFEASTELDSSVYLSFADNLCGDWKIDEAIEILRKAVRLNVNDESVRIALYGIEVLNRFTEYQKKGYRFCPSSINASTVSVNHGIVKFADPYLTSFGPYRLGARGRYEDRIFGIKVFRYLNQFMGNLWDEKWIPGYTEEKTVEETLQFVFEVSDGGSVTVPAGSFDNCRKITLRVDKPADAGEKWYFENGYSHMDCGVKEYWFAPGVGIVKIASTWGTECYAECLLKTYSAPAAKSDDYLPIQIGNSWEYDEPHLTEEGYRAKEIFRIASGMNGKYLMTWSQEFICYKTEDEYNEYVKISHRY